jgi:aspartate 1-decarboxylase
MLRTFLKSKIHGAVLTGKKLHYDGSIEIDMDLLDKAGIAPYERVQVLNFNNGKRITTYTLPGERGSKTFSLAGPSARMGEVGDRIIIIAYCQVDEKELESHKPKVLVMGDNNTVKETH